MDYAGGEYCRLLKVVILADHSKYLSLTDPGKEELRILYHRALLRFGSIKASRLVGTTRKAFRKVGHILGRCAAEVIKMEMARY